MEKKKAVKKEIIVKTDLSFDDVLMALRKPVTKKKKNVKTKKK